MDTNILLYALNADCQENKISKALLSAAIKEPDEWIIAEQVYLELYNLLRNPKVLQKPLTGKSAIHAIRVVRENSGFQHCAFESSFFSPLSSILSDRNFHYRRTFDVVLALTLSLNGVRTFYTRNTKDFSSFGLFNVVNPLND